MSWTRSHELQLSSVNQSLPLTFIFSSLGNPAASSVVSRFLAANRFSRFTKFVTFRLVMAQSSQLIKVKAVQVSRPWMTFRLLL